jgi:hypothetical protein
MSKKKKSKNSGSPQAISVIGDKNEIRGSDEAILIMYERLFHQMKEEIRDLQNQVSFLKAQLSIKQRMFPE